MKLSELNAEELCIYLAEITPFIIPLMEDERISKIFLENEKEINEDEYVKAFIPKLVKLIPVILKDHRDNLFGILAISYKMSIDDIKKVNAFKLIFYIVALYIRSQISHLKYSTQLFKEPF